MTQSYLNIASELIPIIAAAVLGYLYRAGVTVKKRQEALIMATRALCKGELRRIYVYGREHGNKLSSEDWQLADDIYSAYHGLGGNGRGTKLIEKIHEMGTA